MDGDSPDEPQTDRPSATQRWAAVAALVALVGALAVVAFGVATNPARIVVGLLLVGVAVAAGWGALIHTGLRRVLAGVVALVALVAVVVLLDLSSVVRIVALVVLVALSVAAVERALAGEKPVAGGQTVEAATRGVLFLNPRSGGGKVGKFGLEELARRRGVRPVVLQPGDDLRALAEQAVADGADVLGMAGGDGSQALVADVARHHGVPLVCVPAGTRNHFALDLGLDREDVGAALEAFGRAREVVIDLAEIGGRVFVNNASLGVYAAVVQSDEYRDAKLTTTARLLPGLVGPDSDRTVLVYESPDGQPSEQADVVLVSNNVYRLESLRGFGTRERLDAGRLGVVTVSVGRSVDMPALMAAELAGHVDQYSGYRSWSAPEFVVDSPSPLVDVGVDGEALRLPPPLRFRVLPGCLHVRIPRSARRGAPPVRRLAEVVPALWRVAAGRGSPVSDEAHSTRAQ